MLILTISSFSQLLLSWTSSDFKSTALHKIVLLTLAGVAQRIECRPEKPKGHRFNTQSGHMPGMWAKFPVWGAWEATTHWCFSPSLSPSLPLCIKIKINKIFKKLFFSWSSNFHVSKSNCLSLALNLLDPLLAFDIVIHPPVHEVLCLLDFRDKALIWIYSYFLIVYSQSFLLILYQLPNLKC